MIFVIDNYDSFTYNLVQYLYAFEKQITVRRNDEISFEMIHSLNPAMILISPGPGAPDDAGICVDIVKHFAGEIPLFGVCLGHQCIAQAFGAKIICAAEPVHGKVHSIHHFNKACFNGLKNPLNVTRYHSLLIQRDSLSPEFEITAETEAGEIMGIVHKDYCLEGIQFHPEALLTEFGKEMLHNFYKRAQKNNA